jgi:beta-galactosidase
VWLVIKNPVCITPLDYASPGIYLKQTKVSKEEAIVDVLVKVSNGLDERATVQSRPMVDLITQSQGQLFSPLQME